MVKIEELDMLGEIFRYKMERSMYRLRPIKIPLSVASASIIADGRLTK